MAREEAATWLDEDHIRSSDGFRRLLVATTQAQDIKRLGYSNLRKQAEALVGLLTETLNY